MTGQTQTLQKARLIELRQDLSENPSGKNVEVQFNPETMKVTFGNQVAQPAAGDQSAGNSGIQFVGAGTTKLALTLWFDVSAMADSPLDDVRRLTSQVVYFMNPKDVEGQQGKLAPPGLRFSWGSFIFDGVVEALEESLEYFSAAGKPLRASIALTVAQQKIWVSTFTDSGRLTGRPGARPLTPAKAGDSLQNLAGNAGAAGTGAGAGAAGGGWQAIAAGNNIEDPLRLQPGALIDLSARADVNVAAGFGGSGAGLSLGLN